MIVSGFFGLLIMSSISCCVLCFYAFALMYDIGIKFDMIWYDMIWCSCRKPGLLVPFAWDFGKVGPTLLLCRKDLQCRRPGLVCQGSWQYSAVELSLLKTQTLGIMFLPQVRCYSPGVSARLDLGRFFTEKTSSAVGPGCWQCTTVDPCQKPQT